MNHRSLLSGGIPFGRIGGIELRIHWTLLAWFAFILYQGWSAFGSGDVVLRILIIWATTFATILWHEMGHCIAARQQGGSAESILLWPLGGLAYCDAPRLPRNQFWVAAGGPLAQLIPTAIVGALLLWRGEPPDPMPLEEPSLLRVALQSYFWWNVFMLGFNLIPLYPLDGGRMFQAILWGKMKSYGRATLATIWTSRVVGIVLILVMIFTPYRVAGFMGLLIVAYALMQTEGLRARLQSGDEGEDHIFGYDFSRGYTSLERTATRNRPQAPPSLLQRLRTRSREKRELREAEIHRRVDGLLDKISRHGLPSLTRQERKFLAWASRKYKR